MTNSNKIRGVRELWFLVVIFWGCGSVDQDFNETPAPTHTYFRLLDSVKTGITFQNQVKDRDDFNILSYRNYYNGGGVAIGDINNDGLPDLFFTANLTGNQLYVNRGDLRFENVTEKAGVAGSKAWSTGVVMADVNADGWLDIYVSNSGDIAGDNKENELFVNNGNLTFSERANEFGLNNQGYSTQASFFDYDQDGDLDCYLLNNSFRDPSRIELFRSMRDKPDDLGGDKLYRNDDGRFVDVTAQSGIYSSEIGFGLGASVGDINQDHLPDIYVSNDFWERDYLYINQGDGTFREELIERIDFCSISSMGGDIGDINNDGYPEIISTDMLAGDNYRLKAMSAFDPYHLENIKYRANYHYQIGQNCLHLNDGWGSFQEIAMLSDVAATDWSWGALLFDFENNGNLDLFVSNGLQRDLMYMDFRDFLSDNDIYRKVEQKAALDYPSLVSQMPSTPISNYAFTNKGNLQFSSDAKKLGLDQPSFSNGSAYGDLDNDGDYDLVVNNVNATAFIYENEAEACGNHYIKIKFQGPSANPFGIGAMVKALTDQGLHEAQNFNSRGFQSSVEPWLTIGVGKAKYINQLEVVWPDLKKQVLSDLEIDQELMLHYDQASGTASPADMPEPLYRDVTEEALVGSGKHQENRYNDFDHEPLLLAMLSTEGPRIIEGDVNDDGFKDFVVLGARNDPDKLFINGPNGQLQRVACPAFEKTAAFESTCGAFLDHDQDGDEDLLLGSGGNEYLSGTELFTLRYYENDGRGNFELTFSQQLPKVVGNFSTLEVTDIDADGDPDMFLGGRAVPGNYGLPPRSYLFKSGAGEWHESTPEDLAGVGMVTDAVWSDIDLDGDEDLVVVGDWMRVHIFYNQGGSLQRMETIPQSSGWWRRVKAADLDGDGDTDFVLGNWGLNSKLKASSGRPLTMFVNDFDQNGKSEFIINWYAPLDDIPYPFATKMEITSQLPGLRKQSLRYEDYARQTYESLFPAEIRQRSIRYDAVHMESSILWNDLGSFVLEKLPVEAQIAPVFGIVVADLVGDADPDIWLGGNFYGLKPQVGRHAASRGVLLEGKGGRTFIPIVERETGLSLRGEVRDAIMIQTRRGSRMLVARNNEDLTVLDSEITQ